MGQIDKARQSQRSSGATRRSARRGFGQDAEFINRDLKPKEVEAYRAWRADFNEIDTRFGEILQDGYKITVKWDDYGSCYSCFIFAPSDDPNASYILTGRGGTAYRAVAEALYKHYVVFAGEWRPDERSGGRLDDPDF